MSKIFAIGDIHGCLEKLEELMKKMVVDRQEDTLVFIGDYIDRGKSSRGVVDYLIRLQSEYQNVICLRGNHEQMFMDYLDGVNEGLYLGNGGRSTLESYGILRSDDIEERKAKIPEKHMNFFQSLLPYYETDHFIFVHAGLRPELPLRDQAIDDLLWIRFEFIENENDFGKTVVFGHTPMKNLLINKNKIGIDTGAVYGGTLTGVELPEIKIYQA
ncbi:MAG TPA: metallophosphoesterase family protein [Smithella sp.]|jgi:serine/threonine protein phosphatase 1|nr:serine/threonine protein phosphatase [Smithella sp.]MDM7988540.1 metallophosphoesterase family protein [Smithella sp.]HNY51667.1 metallophosphoesterase family protein [Smithella sp.]HOG91675.1 metallophosphoesterase family protein [Smithella sp.]HOU51918.1 metallophosphoesterase family protein [Smithella sp.]